MGGRIYNVLRNQTSIELGDAMKAKPYSRWELSEDPSQRTFEGQNLVQRKGPKYQYGSGVLSNGVIGNWMASICGIATKMSRRRVRRNLKAIFEHNFKPDLREHACTQRPGYVWGNEAGLLLCSWPRGGKPTLSFVYSVKSGPASNTRSPPT